MKIIIILRSFAISLLPSMANFYENIRFLRYLTQWRREGYFIPLPALLKRSLILKEILRIKADVLIETGTYLGDTTWFLRKHIKDIYTIEIDPQLATLARWRFRNWKHIHVIEGDSGFTLGDLIQKTDGTIVYWLDGHYTPGIGGRGSKDCPIWEELSAILQHSRQGFSILIDDVRCFGSTPGYPSVSEISKFLLEHKPGYEFKVEGDIMFFTPLLNNSE